MSRWPWLTALCFAPWMVGYAIPASPERTPVWVATAPEPVACTTH